MNIILKRALCNKIEELLLIIHLNYKNKFTEINLREELCILSQQFISKEDA